MGKHLWAARRLSDHLVLLASVADRLARHHRARRVLAEILGLDEDAVVIEHDEHGKPRLAGVELCVNFSHRDGLLLVGTAADQIGVDVEFVQPGLDIAQALFSPAEAQWLAQTAQADAFTRLWTAKEAVLKAAGLGIAGGMAEPDFAAMLQPGLPFAPDCCDVVHAGHTFRVNWHPIAEAGRPAVACSAIRHSLDTFSCSILPAPAPRFLAAHAG